jgi:hypothetical protein
MVSLMVSRVSLAGFAMDDMTRDESTTPEPLPEGEHQALFGAVNGRGSEVSS